VGVVVLVLVVGFFAWRSFGKSQYASDAPPMQVKPGMFDIKTEAAAGHLGNGLKGGALTGQSQKSGQ
jgi:hypothetical protein